MKDNRDAEAIGNKILELRKSNPSMSITQIADLVLSPMLNISKNGDGRT